MIKPFKITYISSETLLRTIKIKLDTNVRSSYPTWNWWACYDPNHFLLDSTGITTGIKLLIPNTGPNDDLLHDEAVSNLISDADFPADIMSVMAYPNEGKGATFSLEGLDITKRYKITWAGGQNYNTSDDKCSITINGVTKQLLDTLGNPGPDVANVLYRNTWIVDNPTTNLPIVLFPSGGYTAPYYACSSALIVQEYSF